MAELRLDEFVETVLELEAAIAKREHEVAGLEIKVRETVAAVAVTTDPARRRQLKLASSALNEAIADVRAVVDTLRHKRAQVARDAALVARGGIPYGPIWPERYFGSNRRRPISRGIA